MKMIQKEIEVNEKKVELIGYIPGNYDEIEEYRKHPAVIVLPGGGYEFKSNREKENVALKFLAEGICAFTLDYHVAPEAYFPQALMECYAAIAYVRNHAKEWNIDTDNVSVCGFSAGGHLACSAGAFWNQEFVKETFGNKYLTCKPDKMILCYPVITSGPYAHRGSVEHLLGDQLKEQELVELISLENQITEDFPPTFLWHTMQDNCVPVENSLLLATQLAAHKIPLELHIYPGERHGLSLGTYLSDTGITYQDKNIVSEWIQKAIDFIYR